VTRPAAGALLAVAALAAGCGGDGRLSKEAFVKQGDAICRDYNAKIGALKAPAAASDVPAYLDRAKRELDLALARLRLLKPPTSASGDFARLLALSDETRRVTDDLKAAAQSGDRKALRAASQRGEELNRREDEISRRLGLTECVHA
jgi:hypothetical protein